MNSPSSIISRFHPGPQIQKRLLFWNGLHVKFTGDSGILAPQFIATTNDIDEMMEILHRTLAEFR